LAYPFGRGSIDGIEPERLIMGLELDPSLVESVTKKKRGQRFASVRHGLDTNGVDDFLVTIASRIEALEAELHEVRATVEDPSRAADLEQALPPPPALVEEVPDHAIGRIARLGVVGEREISRMLGDAKAEAATIVAEARSEADRIRADAQAGARRSVEEARAFIGQMQADAGMMLSDVAEQRRTVRAELLRMQRHLVNVANDLDLVLKPARPETDAPGGSKALETGAGS
jgi:cell division septum initiation protein DivIVA